MQIIKLNSKFATFLQTNRTKGQLQWIRNPKFEWVFPSWVFPVFSNEFVLIEVMKTGICTNSLWLTFTGKYFPGNTHLNSIIVFASAFDHWKGTQFRIILILTTSFSKENARGLNSHIIVITVLEKRYSQVSDPAFCTFFATFEELKTQFYTLILGMYSHIIHLYPLCASTKYFTDNIPFPWKWPML